MAGSLPPSGLCPNVSSRPPNLTNPTSSPTPILLPYFPSSQGHPLLRPHLSVRLMSVTPSLPPWEHRQLVVCHCFSRTGCTGGAWRVSGNRWGTDAPGHERQTRLHRVSRAVPSGPRWPATQWHPQLQGELRHCERLAGRKYLSCGPWEVGAPWSAPGWTHYTHSCVCPRAWPFSLPHRPVMYTRPPRKLQKMS